MQLILGVGSLKMRSCLNLISVIFLLVPSLSWGSSIGSGPHLKVELISEQKILAVNESAYLGFKFDLDPQWHIYWENPGDSGIPPKIKWTLPQGLIPGEIQWPSPERIDVPPLADYGYEKEVLLMVPLQIPAGLKSSPISIKAEVNWLVCKEICIPGHAHLDLSLPLKERAEENPKWATLFQATRLTLPQTKPTDLKFSAFVDPDSLILQIKTGLALKGARFFPRFPMVIDNASPQKFESLSAPGLSGQITLKKSDQLVKDPTSISGILQVQTSGGVLSYDVESSVPPLGGAKGVQAVAPVSSWMTMIFFAFVGGLLLNLMPCVFPVLSMKVFGFLKMQGETKRKHLHAHAFFYTLGILISFWILVGVLLGLKTGGEHLGWGFQLQSPAFVGVLCGILFLFGLSLIGVFDMGSSLLGVGNTLTRQSGNAGAFFTGVLATVVSTPCTGPFMGAAVGFALSQSTVICFLIFTALALGLALPYVVLALVPSLGKFLPRPGAWMETLKQITAFLIFGTVIWLLWVLSVEAGSSYLIVVLASFLVLSMGAWIFHRWPGVKKAWALGMLFIVLALAGVVIQNPNSSAAHSAVVSAPVPKAGDLTWEEFSPARVQMYRQQGKNVFVDFTAAWCLSCKVNELVVFHSQEVKDKIKGKNVALLKADWTNHDQVITEALASFGRSGVPAYALYEKNNPAGAALGGSTAPLLLPEVISPGIVIKALDQLP